MNDVDPAAGTIGPAFDGGEARGYVGARARAAVAPTGQLRRVERGYRRLATSGQRLGRAGVAAWAAVRAELRQQGRRVPDTDRRPGRWWR